MDKKTTIIIGLIVASLLAFGGLFIYKNSIPKEEPKQKLEIQIERPGNEPIKIETEYEKKHIRVRPFVDIKIEGEKKK